MEQVEPNISSYCSSNPAFDHMRVLLCHLFFINEDRTKYVSVGFYPERDIYHWWNMGRTVRRRTQEHHPQ
jgi:hypothetical protein